MCYIGLEQQEDMNDIELLTLAKEEYEIELASFRMENIRLEQQHAELEATAARLQEMLETLETIEKQVGGNADEIFKQVRYNQDILESNEVCIESKIAEDSFYNLDF